MQFLSRHTDVRAKRTGSRFALAIAIASTAALGVAAFEAPAYAAKKEKKAEAPKSAYSPGFIAAYKPLEELSKAQPKDTAAIAAGLPTMVTAIQTPDDRFAAGNLVYATGRDTSNRALQRQGIALMLDSGKVPTTALADYHFIAGQLAYQENDWAVSRKHILAALDSGYSKNDPQGIVAETYFNENQPVEGLKYLATVVNARTAAGATVDENWLKRGIAVAYKNNLPNEAASFASMLVRYYPSTTSWGDAIAIQRNYSTFDSQEMLDLMRLADRTNSLRSERDYVEYLEAADARRLPGEVSRVVEAGIASGIVKTSDVFINEVRTTAKNRLSADQAEIPALERDARKPSATALTAMAAGDALLSYGKAGQAEEMYSIALTKPGVDTQRVLNRLGIAQVDQGKTAEAKATFAKIDGKRKPIASLWALYADQKAKSAAPAT